MNIEDLLPTSILQEAEWGDLVNRREYLFDTPGWGFGPQYDQRIDHPSDRARGKCYPFFESEQDLATIRGIARFLAGSTEIAIAALENLANYTIGNGLTYTVEARKEGDQSQEAVIATIQATLDEELERLNWIGDMEVEAFNRAHRDGEGFLWVREHRGQPEITLVEPSFITEPIPARDVEDYCGLSGLEWSFGVATDHRNYERRHAYFIQWEGSKTDWDVAPAEQMVHIRHNVDRGVKRGISDFYAAYLNMERSTKLLGNTMQGAAIQATIAYIRELAAGTSSDAVVSARNSRSDAVTTFNRPGGGSRQVRQEKFFPGRVVDAVGVKYHAGPLGQSSAPTYIDVMQAGIRVVGARWQMPEYMISGDASNANYSSTLVAGGPFDRATQRRQGFYKKNYSDVCWKVLDIRCRQGRFRQLGINCLRDLKRVVQLKIEAPAIAVQDREAEERIREIRHNAGILSKKTWAAQADLDYEVELANGAAEKVEPSPFGMPGQLPPAPGQPQAKPPVVNPYYKQRELPRAGQPPQRPADEPKRAAVAAALESVQTTEEARAVLSEVYP